MLPHRHLHRRARHRRDQRPVAWVRDRRPGDRLQRGVRRALNLFDTEARLDTEALRLAQALADVATIGLLQARAIQRRELLAEQLQSALNSRVIIEQAKGVIAERRSIDMDQSFSLLRRTARTNNRRLSELARAVVDGSVEI
jgi:hypothetical protein